MRRWRAAWASGSTWMPPGGVTWARCSDAPTVACAAWNRCAPSTGSSRSRKCTPPSRRWHAPIRSPSIRTSWATCPTAPVPSSAVTIGAWRCCPSRPTTYSARVGTATWPATGNWASSSRKAPNPGRRPRRCTSPTRCCRWTTPTSACCRGRRCWRPRPSRHAPGVSPSRWHTPSGSACRSHRTATWCAWRSIRAATATWPAPTPSCAGSTRTCAATRANPCRRDASSLPSPPCSGRWPVKRRWCACWRSWASTRRAWTTVMPTGW